MLWPDEAKNAIANVFYDKTIEIISTETQRDEEGGIIRNAQTVTGSFKGNVRFNSLGEVQTELGLVDSIDICITCDVATEIVVNDLFKYGVNVYQATSVIPSDSHLTVVGKKWQ
jgi:hypothetical protein